MSPKGLTPGGSSPGAGWVRPWLQLTEIAACAGAGRDRLPDGQNGDGWMAAECSGPPRVHTDGAGEGRGLRQGRCRGGDDATEGRRHSGRQRPRPGPQAGGGQPPSPVAGPTHAIVAVGPESREGQYRGVGARPAPRRTPLDPVAHPLPALYSTYASRPYAAHSLRSHLGSWRIGLGVGCVQQSPIREFDSRVVRRNITPIGGRSLCSRTALSRASGGDGRP